MNGAEPTTHRTSGRIAIPGLWWKCAAGVLIAAECLAAFLVSPIRNELGIPTFSHQGHGAKLIFFHVPCAWLAVLAYLVAAWYATRVLIAIRKHPASVFQEDWKSATAMELGLLFGTLATVTGSIFSRNEWNMYWNWDPRQTSIVIVLLIFAAYAVLRGAVADSAVRARLAAAYTLLSVIPGLFLLIVLPRIIFTLHGGANAAVVGGGLGTDYRIVLYGLGLPGFLLLFTWMFQVRLRAHLLLDRVEPARSHTGGSTL